MTNKILQEIRTKQVVEAARRCIVEKGIANLSVKDIAREAGVSTGVIYHYFKNKEDIMMRVIVDSFSKSYQEVMNDVEPVADPVEKLMSYVDKAQATALDNPDFYVVLANYMGQAHSNPEITKTMVRFFGSLTKYVGAIAENINDVDKTLVNAIPSVVIAMSIGTGVLSTLDSEKYDPQVIGESFKQLLSLVIR